VKDYENVIQTFSLTGHRDVEMKKELGQGCDHSENELVNIAIRYALLTKSTFVDAKLVKAKSEFQAFILLSLCAVLEATGIPSETIDQVMQHATKSSKDARLKQLRGAIWVNGLIAKLVKLGWSIYRATELFFISRSIRFLQPMMSLAYANFRSALSFSTWVYTQ
jgi:hypothetical protein